MNGKNVSDDHENPQRVTVAVVQMSCVESKSANVKKALAEIADAAQRGANLFIPWRPYCYKAEIQRIINAKRTER